MSLIVIWLAIVLVLFWSELDAIAQIDDVELLRETGLPQLAEILQFRLGEQMGFGDQIVPHDFV